jgi:hypothetical protein
MSIIAVMPVPAGAITAATTVRTGATSIGDIIVIGQDEIGNRVAPAEHQFVQIGAIQRHGVSHDRRAMPAFKLTPDGEHPADVKR